MEAGKLRDLKSHLNDCLVAKENSIAVLKKQYSQKNNLAKNLEYDSLEKEYTNEQYLSFMIEETRKYIEKLKLNRELKCQLETKLSREGEEKAEELIHSVMCKAKDEEHRKEIMQERRKVKVRDEAFLQYMKDHEYFKNIESKISQDKEVLQTYERKRYTSLKDLKKEYERLKKVRETLQNNYIQLGLLSSLGEDLIKREEVRDLREEEDCWRSYEEEERVLRRKQEEEKMEVQSLLNGREEQLRIKEEMKNREKEQDREYLKLLTEVMGEEDRLHLLRSEVALRKRKEHFAIAQMILEERRKRRKEIMAHKEACLQEEKELEDLKTSLLEEEEKKLLLDYLPHLGPFLSQRVIQRLSQC